MKTGVPLGVSLHPVQVYDSLVSALILVYLLWLYPRRAFPGQVFATMLAAITTARAVLESFRGDVDRGFLTNWLSLPRFVALLLLLAATVMLVTLTFRHRSQLQGQQDTHS
jgi:phosphatidylglycerol---prolipoprotein diacylglyceryl transferase